MKLVGRNFATRIARKAAEKNGMGSAEARPHQLQLFAELSSSENQYRIPLNAEYHNRIAPGIGRGLLDRDAFLASAIGLAIVPVKVVNGTPYFTAVSPVFWPDPNVFDTPAGTAVLSEAEALESIYWGDHSLKTNTGVRIDKNPNLALRTVQQTQASGSTANMQTGLEVQEIGAVIRFSGGDENEIIINVDCKDKTHIAGTADRKNFLMVVLDGAIIKGATSKAYLR